MASSKQTSLQILQKGFQAGLDAVRPDKFMADVTAKITSRHLAGKTVILGLGKAAGAMVDGYFANGGTADDTLIILPSSVVLDDNAHLPSHAKIHHSAHPVPNEQSEQAARAALSLASSLTADDRLIVLLSGGGSSLMSLGLDGIGLADKKSLNQALLDSGMPIQEVNIIRKHLSAVKGGRLAATAFPAQIETYALSDVPDDDPSAIASGPTVGDNSSKEDAFRLLQHYDITVPAHIHQTLEDERCETPHPEDPLFADNRFEIVASAKLALQAAGDEMQKWGYDVVICDEDYQLDTKTLADVMCDKLSALPMGSALISGGEASVAVKGDGVGGRNAQFALEMAIRNLPDICGIACDTDGIDGAKANAGACFYNGICDDSAEQGIDIADYYARFDSHSFFEKMNCHIVTGATQTNVNDVRILIKGLPKR